MNWYRIAKNDERDYSWIHISVPQNIAAKTVSFSNSIPNEDLYVESDEKGEVVHGNNWTYGVEDDPHITVKWGILTKDVDEIKELLQDMKGGVISLKNVDIFETDDYDVLKVTIDGKALRAINKVISDNLETHNTFPTYNPHITLAYLKTGKGENYQGDSQFKDLTFEFNEVIFEDYEDKQTAIKLG